MKDTEFYNAESLQYSSKRYPVAATTFTQFFFKERLAKTLLHIEKYLKEKHSAVSLLEVGCADGVVVEQIYKQFGKSFNAIDAIDISPGMIEAAKKNTTAPIRYSVREATLPGTYDLVIEVGVLNYSDFSEDMRAVSAALREGGVYICSVAGSSSLQHTLKGGDGYGNLRSYAEYEKEMRNYFVIERAEPVGFFVPLLWKVPVVARAVQPIVEWLLKPLQSLALEKVYVLKRNQKSV
jgi:SAM-dependent methyltransferase